MTDNTEESWILNGVSVHQFGWSVTTVGGSRYDIPPRRGSNMVVGYRPGQVNRPKMPDARTITLVMWMAGWDPALGPVAGPLPTSENQRTQWNDNWDTLRRMVFENYLNDGLISITRKWRLTAPTFPTTRVGDIVIAGDPGTPTSGVSRLLAATAYGEIAGNMAPTMTGRTRSDFQIDLTLPDPYFYDSTTSQATLTRGGPVYVWNDGHDVAAHNNLTVDLVGPLTNPLVYNLTPQPDIHLSYFGTIPSGQIVTLNIGRFTAIQHAPSATTGVNKIAAMSNSGSRLWLNLLPGANKLSLAADAGTGTAVVRWRHPYI